MPTYWNLVAVARENIEGLQDLISSCVGLAVQRYNTGRLSCRLR